jgi:2-oxoadipate dioxygenase/decarboxylase
LQTDRTDVDTLFHNLWENYCQVTPSAERIHRLLDNSQGKAIVNDHIALRTFNIDKLNLEKLAAHFLALGYEQGGEYHFDAKKLYARHYEHPDPTVPKVFISELLVEQCSDALQSTVHQLVDSVSPTAVEQSDFLYSGRHWNLDYATYQTLLEESEYAAWMAAWGYRANHFTVSVNQLSQFRTLAEVNQRLKDEGFRLNTSGGEIKGSPQDLLEQSSTMADRADVAFSDQTVSIPSCFYEFALRYPKPDGELYSGFVAASADKIFESTDSKG